MYHQQKRDLPKKQNPTFNMYNVSRFASLYINTLCTMCCIFPHVYTSKKRLLLFSTETSFNVRSVGWLYGCTASFVVLVIVSWLLLCQYVILSVFLAIAMRLPSESQYIRCVCVCVFVPMWVCVYAFSVHILNTIGIVKYLEGGVFIHDCCCCKEQWCENKHSQAFGIVWAFAYSTSHRHTYECGIFSN